MRSPLVAAATAAALLLAACTSAPGAQPPADSGRAGPTAVAAPRDSLHPASIARARVPLVPTPDTLRGLYVNRWAAIGQKIYKLIDVAKRTEVNALVIDVKDDRGYMLYRSRVPLAREIGLLRIGLRADGDIHACRHRHRARRQAGEPRDQNAVP